MDICHLAVIGVGSRGQSLLRVLAGMEDVRVDAVCDNRAERVTAAQSAVEEAVHYRPAGYADWHEALAHPGLRAVVIATPWFLHIPVTVAAMKRGIRPACEVGAAFSVDDCWKLIDTYEETGVPAMLLENRCFNRDAMTLLQMSRAGLFGKIVACQMGYRHDLRYQVGGDKDPLHGRVNEYLYGNSDNYATHPLGPCARLLNVNRGNRMESLTAMATGAFGMADYTARQPDHPLAGRTWKQGDIVTVLIKLALGEVITLTLDTTLPRPYSHNCFIHGTRGMYNGETRAVFLEGVHEETTDNTKYLNNLDGYRPEYEHPVWKNYNPDAGQAHGGQDYLTLRAFLDSVFRGCEPPIDVYDMAAWKSISPLSAASIAQGGHPMEIPDFTRGLWMRERKVYEGPWAI